MSGGASTTGAGKRPPRRNGASRDRRPAAVTWPDAHWRWGEDGALVLVLPVPGSANRQWRAGRGRTYKSAAAREYEESAGWAMASCPKIPGEVSVDIVWFRERRVGDCDNKVKPLLDALKGVAFGDDAAVQRVCIERVDAPDVAACMVVTIRRAV